MVGNGTFREDLYYRLSVIPIKVPPLRDRGDDIVLLANHFLKKYSKQMGKVVTSIAPKSMEVLKSYDWPGNVRVLENTIERAVAMASGTELTIELPGTVARPSGFEIPPDGIDMERYVADIERSLLQTALRRCNGVQTKAADLLHLSYRSFRHLIKKYEL